MGNITLRGGEGIVKVCLQALEEEGKRRRRRVGALTRKSNKKCGSALKSTYFLLLLKMLKCGPPTCDDVCSTFSHTATQFHTNRQRRCMKPNVT